MNKHHRQQAFDTTVALFCEGTVLENISILTRVDQLDPVIDGFGVGNEAGRVLAKIQRFCQAWALPGEFIVRTREYKPLAKNGTTRGKTSELEGKTPARRLKKIDKVPPPPQTARKGVAVEILTAFKRRKGKALTIPELAEIVGKEASTVNYALNGLVKDKVLRRRKAKQDEKINGNIRYVYEVAA